MPGFRSYSIRAGNIVKNWYLIDASESSVGRVAAFVAFILIGKHKSEYTPHMDCGDNIIIINAKDSKFTGNKMVRKRYYWHTGYPGGIKESSPEKWLADDKKCIRILEHAVRGMLGKNAMGRARFKNLSIYPGPDHPHGGQKPQLISVLNGKRLVVENHG